ncbi:MAG: ABC transporter permease [Gammaproteobacteria bacterium]|nr:ABC transporter permease [Gammaproteobacteria bacterium]
MRGIFTVFRKEFVENLRDRRILLSALVFGPVLGPLMLAAVLQISVSRGEATFEKPMTLPVIGAEHAPNLIATLEAQDIKVEPRTFNEQQIREAIATREITLALRIPPDFAERWARSEPAAVEIFADSSDQFGGDASADRVSRAIRAYSRQVSQMRLVLRGVDPVSTMPVVIHDIDVSTPASRASFALGLLSYLAIFAMLFGGMYLAIDATAGERERGSLEALLTAPMPRPHLIYGKIAATTAYMLISMALTLTACAVALNYVRLEEFGMSLSMGPLATLKLFAVSAPLAVLGAGLLTVVASFTRSFREAQSYLTFAISLPTLPLVFIGVLRVEPSPLIMSTPSLSQHFLMMKILRGEALATPDLLYSAGASLLIGGILCWFAGRLYEREAILG